MKKIIRDTLILTAITLISGLALATVYQITKQPIAQAEAAAELAAYEGVFPEATFETLAPASFDPVAAGVADGEGVTVEAVAAARRDGQTVGYALKVTSPNGYGGNITVADQFRGITGGTVVFTKTGKSAPNEIDALSGATITTRAVTAAVNTGLAYARDHLLEGGTTV